MRRLSLFLLLIVATFTIWVGKSYADTAVPAPEAATVETPAPRVMPVCAGPTGRALMLGDSWAQYMWDDGSHNDIFDKYGHAEKDMISQSLGANPGAGYTGPEYAISGSEAIHFADTANYPWIQNVIDELAIYPDIEMIVISIGGNDVLAAKSGGGWYKDMDLDVPGSEQALFDRIEADTLKIINDVDAAYPGRNLQYMVSSYDYVNFNTGFFCFAYACPKRNDLSRDATNDLITDAELNGMMVTVEAQRYGWADADPRIIFDNSVGLMHYYYGNGTDAPGTTPYPNSFAPYTPWPPGNPAYPSLRANFRSGPDPIHLDYDGYQYKITNQTASHFFPLFRGTPDLTIFSAGGTQDGWTDGTATGTGGINLGDNAANNPTYGIITFDTSALPDSATVDSASFYIIRESLNGTNPFGAGAFGTPQIDVISGSFGAVNVEASDAVAAADVSDAGCAYGSAGQNYYAVRVDLTAAGLAAINLTGTTQFRISFPNSDADGAADFIVFKDGDSPMLVGPEKIVTKWETFEKVMPNGEIIQESRSIMAITHLGLAEFNSSPAPFLDINYTNNCITEPPPTLTGPADAAIDVITNPTLTWDLIAGATAYDIEIATDPGFVSIVESALGVTATSFNPATLLNDTDYYWRVRSVNGCGGGAYAAEFTFRTEAVVLSCTTYPSADIPKTIPSTGTVTSVINIAAGSTIVDLNVLNLTGTHARVGQLEFTLDSPLASSSLFMDASACGNLDDFNINFDDEAAPGAFPCPPTDAGTYQPTNALSLFDGEDSTGNWTLTINDTSGAGGGTGQLDSWAIEICSVAPSCTPPTDIVDAAPAAAGGDVNLSWTDTDGDSYEVHRDTVPYFPTGAGTLQATITPATQAYPDVGALGNPATNYYYYILPTKSCGTANSNHIGEFDFTIVPGA